MCDWIVSVIFIILIKVYIPLVLVFVSVRFVVVVSFNILVIDDVIGYSVAVVAKFIFAFAFGIVHCHHQYCGYCFCFGW